GKVDVGAAGGRKRLYTSVVVRSVHIELTTQFGFQAKTTPSASLRSAPSPEGKDLAAAAS
ncbi:MAG TPA: hypothetical protein VMP03_05555, partial [Methylomirabilota bacterium]|nr:hypothetical protein [Methylomirabilota bacterium]